MNSFLLLFCLIIPCITSTAGSHAYNYGHPLLRNAMTGPKGLPLLHNMQKRQTTVEEGYVCDGIQTRATCTSGLIEAYAIKAAQCNETTIANILEERCRVNAVGDTCGELLTDDRRGQAVCWRARRNDEPPVCTTECRDYLIATRDALGCCANIYNDSSNALYEPEPFSYSLWSLCGVELLTEQCAPGPFHVPDDIPIDPTCTALDQFFPDVVCGLEYVEAINNALVASGCEIHAANIYRITRDFCTVDKYGHYCNDGTNLYPLSYYAEGNCGRTDVCEPHCLNALNNITEMVDCCYVSHFNQTSFTNRDHLSYEFWQRCGLTSPGSCETRFVDVSKALSLSAPSKIVIFTVAIFTIVLSLALSLY